MEMEQIFEQANRQFLEKNYMLLENDVSERTLCGAFMLELYEVLKKTRYKNYYVDVEYNRNKGGKIKTAVKTIALGRLKVIKINCDLIVHSRGENSENDNLISLEMKKSRAKQEHKQEDRNRLMALTKDTFDDIWSYDGKTFPEHVCRYQLGVYYELDYKKKKILIEYYHKGECTNSYVITY